MILPSKYVSIRKDNEGGRVVGGTLGDDLARLIGGSVVVVRFAKELVVRVTVACHHPRQSTHLEHY